MDVFAVDSNVLLSFLTERDLEQQEATERLLVDAALGEVRLLIPQFVLFEIAHVLRSRYDASPAFIRESLTKTIELQGVEIIDSLRWERIIRLWPDTIPHFTDAAMAAFSIEIPCSVATFDVKFGRHLHDLGIATWDFAGSSG